MSAPTHSNFMGKGGFNWFQGVVEDRNDPKKLGRVRVRFFGLHTDDKQKLPTALLPWAFPIQPISSAGVSGIGQTPVGPVPGTHVVGFFRDKWMQEPMYWGTLSGIPSDGPNPDKGFNDPDANFPIAAEENDVNGLSVGNLTQAATKANETRLSSTVGVVRANKTTTGSTQSETTSEDTDDFEIYTTTAQIGEVDSSIYENSSDARSAKNLAKQKKIQDMRRRRATTVPATKAVLQSEAETTETSTSSDIVDIMLPRLRARESSGNYQAVNRYGFLGAFQFGGPALQDLGMVKKGRGNRNRKWTGKYGASSESTFLNTPSIQDRVFRDWVNILEKRIDRNGLRKYQGRIRHGMKITREGLIAAAHLGGVGNLKKYLNNGIDFRDGNSTSIREYLTGLPEYAGETGQIVVSSWNEPDPYEDISLASYPNVKVNQTESGHVFMTSDEPDLERVHIQHKDGSYIHFDPVGNLVFKSNGNRYSIVLGNDFAIVKGEVNLEVEGNINLNVVGDCNLKSDLVNVESTEVNITTTEKLNVQSSDDIDMKTSGDIHLEAKQIHLSSNKAQVDNLFTNNQTTVGNGGHNNGTNATKPSFDDE